MWRKIKWDKEIESDRSMVGGRDFFKEVICEKKKGNERVGDLNIWEKSILGLEEEWENL